MAIPAPLPDPFYRVADLAGQAADFTGIRRFMEFDGELRSG